ncbi:undecaprenyldiphospho-muramoylpentapeptide beta-N-acetylglucosaminyltransferase [Pedobacter alluvionis]|uniref:UDP-N-acetylglucosamine--N-acetylmuramyl-(pentapeptide) pyrophosphoryl-undecaprenol N-acetylglucosamine transferase n=1 Tax=Pedobacter alluvionis TaxID=475253 RepID=A0A497YB89_9SPHI|nr:undecaprenyldiphospho-muramoylpentapeptide beta-N-acetylglucosaminyltransferase [Pedobacter alluvionis]RLJ79736.1 UDP-N-acetylglucosamine-N-acetylmuramylpentapeptide N-acetylglucosamine transferase [Pedobacter alluvionis]TFB31056.1 undecaprenyldiphospho-muramoylpentapeptide beta-N-acetylglucosaminyltransferase [Pedobacter alluvionis]
MNNSPKIIISGGGTGGHIFPAVAIANALKRMVPTCEILFVGALGRMEMEKVPAAGYKIIGLNISGMQRGSIIKNLVLPFKVIGSVRKAMQIINDFKPDVVVGVGGYASGPLLYAASLKGIPYLIQEQNSYAGITNKWLGKKASKICVAFDDMDQFFPADRILKTGNPVRQEVVDIKGKHFQGAELLKLDPLKKTIMVTGGSLGAGTLNKAIEKHLPDILAQDVQVIWQTGKYYYKGIIERLGLDYHPNVRILEFLNKMDLAYAAADVIVSRAGAGTIAELCLIKKPVILVPSPNVAEDHQTKNAMALVKNGAAILINDRSAEDTLVKEALVLLTNKEHCETLAQNLAMMALPQADEIIANEVLKLIKLKVQREE